MERLVPFSIAVVSGMTVSHIAQEGLYWKTSTPFYINRGDDYRYAANADKLGHAFAAYAIAKVVEQGLQWSGVDTAASVWIGAAVAFTNQLLVEYRDATSTTRNGQLAPYLGWSWGDMLANTAGAMLPILQHYWGEQSRFLSRLRFKYSLHSSGNVERGYFRSILDDYESQYHWLCVPLDVVLGGEPTWWKQFFGIGVGHSVRGIIRADGSFTFAGTHELWLTLDYNLEAISSEHPLVRAVLRIANLLRLPAPCVRIMPGVAVFGFRW